MTKCTFKAQMILLALASVSSLAISTPGQAQTAAAPRTVDFDIPSQDLQRALDVFAQQSDADLVFNPAIVRGLRSTELRGRSAVADGLARLLSTSGLRARQVEERTFAIQRGADPQDDSAAGTSPIAGVVSAASNGAALPGARVTVTGTDMTTVTDERGRFYLPAVPLGADSISVEYLGLETSSYPLSMQADGRQRIVVAMGDPATDIVVLGFSSAIQRALNQQLRADNSATIVSADLLGSFPAETVSEALRRLPGVAFGRAEDTGEGSRITVRGFSSEAINIQLNGLDLQGTGFERTIDLSGFLAENISQVTIQKSLLPSHESNGSGGLVEIETKSGLDYGKFSANLAIEGERNGDSAFGEEYQVSGTIGGKLTDNFGVVATVQYRRTNRVNYGADVAYTLAPVLPVGFTSLTFVPASRQFPFDAALNSALPTGVSYSRRDRDEDNLTASLNFAWDVSPTTNLRLDLQRIQRDAYTTTARTSASFLTTAFDMPIPELNGEVRRRSTISSLRPNLGLVINDINTVSDSVSLRGKTELDRWTFNYKAGFSRAKSESDNSNLNVIGVSSTNINAIVDRGTARFNPDDDAARTQRLVGGAVVFLDNGLPILSLTPLGSDTLNNPANYNVNTATKSLTNSPTNAYILEGSARYRPAASWFEYVEVGGKFDRSERKSADELFATTSVGALKSLESYIAIAAAPTTLSFFGSDLTDGSTLRDIGAGSFSAPFLREAAVDAIFNGLPGLITDNPSTPFNERRFNFTDRRGLDPILNVGGLIPAQTTEERRAGYVEAKFEIGKFDLVGGVRYESQFRSGRTLTSPSVRLPNNVLEPRETFVTNGLVDFNDLSGTQSVLTPSMIANYRPTDNLVARFAYFRSTVNPDFRLIRRATQVSIDLRPAFNTATLIQANPDLRPTKTDNFDVDLSYYFKDTPGLARVAFFYKNVKNNFTNVFFQAGPDSGVRDEILAYFGELATTRPDLVAFDSDTAFLRNRPENGAGGKIYGFELELIRQLTFLPGLFKNVTFLGNLTYTKGDFPTLLSGRNDDGTIGQFTLNRPLGDQAAWVYNTSLSYAKGGFEGRVIYTYQSATADNYEIHGLDEELPAYDTLDVRLSYNFKAAGADMSVYLQGDDLLRGSKEVDLRRAVTSRFNGGDADFYFPDTYQFNGGRTFTAGLRVRF